MHTILTAVFAAVIIFGTANIINGIINFLKSYNHEQKGD